MSKRWVALAAGALALAGAGGLSAVALAELQGDEGVDVCGKPSGVVTLADGGGCKANERSLTLADVALVAELEKQLQQNVATIAVMGKAVDEVERVITIVVSEAKQQGITINLLQDEVADLEKRVAKLEAERK